VVVLHVVELLQSQLEGVGSLTAVALRADNQCSVPVWCVCVCVCVCVWCGREGSRVWMVHFGTCAATAT
jgi:hypothetical protein